MAAVGAALLLAVISTGGKAIATVDSIPQPAHRATSASTRAQGDLQRPAGATPAGQARRATAAGPSDGARLTPLPSSSPEAFVVQTASGGAPMSPEPGGAQPAAPTSLHGALARAIQTLAKPA